MSNITTTGKQSFSLTPSNLQEAMQFSEMIANSSLVPSAYKGKPGDVLVAIQMGMEVGLQPMQALQGIAVINGKPAMYGDALIGVVRSSPVCESIQESFDDASQVATCRVKRRGEDWQERSFSRQDAELARLWGKQGPWSQYPKRMMQMRARAWALRDVFPDALQGMAVAEEVRDMTPEKEINPHIEPSAAMTVEKQKSVLSMLKSDAQQQPEPQHQVPEWSDEQEESYQELIGEIQLAESQEQLSALANSLAGLGDMPEGYRQHGVVVYKAKKEELESKSE